MTRIFTSSYQRTSESTEDMSNPITGAYQIVPSEDKGNLRPSGIDVIGSVPWGTHFCEFYETGQDLVETLVPYFIAGLNGNEYCMWVTSNPLQVDEAKAAMRLALPDFEDYLSKGQIEFLDYRDWYIRQGRFDAALVLEGWSEKLAAARQNGFEGLRLSGNTFWLEKANWEDFTRYEESINNIIGSQRMIALCTYSLEKCGVHEILDVVANHQFALIKTGGRWEIIESAEHEKIEHALRESEQRFRSLFTQMNEGFALHEIICDSSGIPIDYRFLEVNPAFEQLTGFLKEVIIGKTVLEVMPQTEPFWIETYGEVALSGKPKHFQNYSQTLDKYYDVRAFSPQTGQFAALFIDITEQITMRKQAKDAEAHIELQRRLNEQREQERLYIAQELHDGPIQELTAATYALQAILNDCVDPALIVELKGLRKALSSQITDLRAYSQELRPPLLAQFGVEKAIRAYLLTFEEKHPEISAQFHAKNVARSIPEAVEHAVYRIFQEGLNNIVKHSQASQVVIRLLQEKDTLTLSIEDNGVGFEPPGDWMGLVHQGHLGLVGIRERAESVGGILKITSGKNKGTHLLVQVPIKS